MRFSDNVLFFIKWLLSGVSILILRNDSEMVDTREGPSNCPSNLATKSTPNLPLREGVPVGCNDAKCWKGAPGKLRG